MRDFHSLKVWQKSHALVLGIYVSSRRFPAAETYGLTSQLRRAAVSIPANIAEGCGRGSNADFARCAQIAMGSASEVEYLLLLARDLTYLTPDKHAPLDQQVTEVKRMLSALLAKLRADS
jgi:four helix bundle protein